MNWFSFNLHDFTVSFLGILFEGVPFMFIGTLISGVIDAFVPQSLMESLLPRNPIVSVVCSSLLGTIFPMCECGVVPVIRRMIRKGLPVSCALTYLLAAPIINPVCALSTFAAFRGQNPSLITSLRLLGGFLVACMVGLIVHRLPIHRVLNSKMMESRPGKANSGPKDEPATPIIESISLIAEDSSPRVPMSPLLKPQAKISRPAGFGSKVIGAVRCASFDFLDVGFYLIIGAAITSVFNTAINKDVILPLASHGLLATGALMVLALLLSLCSTSDAFIAANFLSFPLVSKLAFMVFGPMMDLKLFFMYGLVFRKRFTVATALALFVLVGLVCVVLGTLANH